MVAVLDTPAVYQPRRDLRSKLRRRLVRRQASRTVPLALDRPIVCLTFDDVPDSVLHTALPMLEDRGHRATLYVATGLMGHINHLGRMMDDGEVREAHERGHEIAAHTHSHRDFAQLPLEAQLDDFDASSRAFDALGLPAPRSFAWPYGECTREGKRAAAARYASLRGIAPRIHRGRLDLNEVGSVPMFTGQTATVERALDDLQNRPGLLTLFTHDVRDDCSPWGLTPAELANILDCVDASGASVLTVADAVMAVGG